MRHVRTLMLGASAILMMVPLSIPAADAANGGDIEAAPIEATLPDGRTVGEAATADLMDALVAKIYALPDQAGFAGVTVDGTARTVTLQWKGEPPATGLEEVRAAADDGSIRLVVRATDFSESEIMDAGRLLFQKFDGAPERPSAFHGTPTRDGLIVTVAKTVVEKVGKTELQNQFRSIVAIPVTVEARDIFPASRQNDASNWSGGAAMISTAPEPEFCSTGFAVLDGVYGRLLSAAHCDFTGDYSWYDGTDSDIFTYGGSYVDIKKSGWDSMLIDPVVSRVKKLAGFRSMEMWGRSGRLGPGGRAVAGSRTGPRAA